MFLPIAFKLQQLCTYGNLDKYQLLYWDEGLKTYFFIYSFHYQRLYVVVSLL